jgi:asparagine synthase (glutamine-hydrolysing)
MCGICGQFNFKTGKPVLAEALRGMASAMVHRGPDDDGIFLDGDLGLGFRRLSIIDLSTGHQPMSTIDGQVTLVFNGEIFNFRELRAELLGKGHSFRTTSDTSHPFCLRGMGDGFPPTAQRHVRARGLGQD